MFDTICTLPLISDLLVQTLHPTEPILSVGLASGHVQTYRLPSESSPIVDGRVNGHGKRRSSSSADSAASVLSNSSSVNGFGHIATEWQTRRHKGSCRALAFSTDGETLFSAGTDGVLKAAATATGQVIAKLAVYSSRLADADHPSLLHALSPQTLLLATDTGRLSLYDLRADTKPLPRSSQTSNLHSSVFHHSRPAQTHYPHHVPDDPIDDPLEPITSLTALPPSSTSTSGFPKQWATTAGSTLAVTDLRKGVVAQSIDQGDMLLSSCCTSSSTASRADAPLLVGGARGFVTRWARGAWQDQRERIYVGRRNQGGAAFAGARNGGSGVQSSYRWQASQEENEDEATVDSLAVVPEQAAASMRAARRAKGVIAAGLGTGAIRFVGLGGAERLLGEVRHDETGIEGVVGLGFDVTGRMISGGGSVVKVWFEPSGEGEEEGEQDDDNEEESDELDELGMDEADGPSDESDEEDDEERAPKRKKRRKGKGRGGNADSGIISLSGL